MITQLYGNDRIIVAPLFANMDDTTILSCIRNNPGSHVWVDDAANPTCAHALMGGAREGTCGFSFVAGDHTSPAARELIAAWPAENVGYCTIVPENEDWAALIEDVFPSAPKQTRYAMSKTEYHFDREKLRGFTADPAPELSIRRIDASMYDTIYIQGWSRDLVANFPDSETFERMAVGFVCLCGNDIVGGASCYSVYDRGIEIEVDTREDFRRRGIARACASSLVLYALEHDLYPSWDAANLMSVGLARSLGYVFSHEYPAYWLSPECRKTASGKE